MNSPPDAYRSVLLRERIVRASQLVACAALASWLFTTSAAGAQPAASAAAEASAAEPSDAAPPQPAPAVVPPTAPPGYRPYAPQQPAGYPPNGYPPNGYPPSGYPPTGYPPNNYPRAPAGVRYPGHLSPQDPPPPPPPRMERLSVPLMVGGIVLISAGALGVIGGLVLLEGAEDQDCTSFPCDTTDEGQQVAGAVVAGVGLAAVAGGIPMTLVGARRVPVAEPPFAAAIPQLQVGPAAVRLRWRW